MISPLSDLLSPSLVKLDLVAKNEGEAIRAVTALLDGHPSVVNADRLAVEVLEREKLSPTALGHGVSFPHARTEQVRKIVMAIGRSREGVPVTGSDAPVNFFFVIGTPPNQAPQYLALLGRLARLLGNAAVRERLLEAPTAAEFLTVLQA